MQIIQNYILKDENAVFYECGYSCDNEIFICYEGKNFFITDARYGIEAKECINNAEVIICNDINEKARELFTKLNVKKITLNPYDFSVADFNDISANLRIEFDLQANFSQKKRIIKTQDEIKILEQAANFGKKGFDKVCEFIKQNLDKNLSEQELNYQAANLLQDNGNLGLSFAPITAINANAAKAHALATKTSLKQGDLLLFDAGVKFKRYCSDRTRTLEINTNMQISKKQNFTSSKQNEIYAIVLEAQQAAINAIKPGVLASEVDKAARDVISKAGFADNFFHSTGHGVGLDIHELPRINSRSNEVLQEGMVFSVEPGIYLANEFGVRIEDVVVVTKDSAKIL